MTTSNDDNNNRVPIEQEETSTSLTQQELAVGNFIGKDEEKISIPLKQDTKMLDISAAQEKIDVANTPDNTTADEQQSSKNDSKNDTKNKQFRWRWKKPKGKPRRPMSAYNCFFKCERQRILSEHNNKSGGFSQLAKVISEKWKTLSSDDRIVYQQQAERETVKYHIAVQEWQNQNQNHDQQIVDNRNLGHQMIDNYTVLENQIISANPLLSQYEMMSDYEMQQQNSSISSSAVSLSNINYFGRDFHANNNDSYNSTFEHHNNNDSLFCIGNDDMDYQSKRRQSLDSSMAFQQATTNTDKSNNDSDGSSGSIRSVTPYDEPMLRQSYQNNNIFSHLQTKEDYSAWLQQQQALQQHQNFIPENISNYHNKHIAANLKQNGELDVKSTIPNTIHHHVNEAFFQVDTRNYNICPDHAFNDMTTIGHENHQAFTDQMSLKQNNTKISEFYHSSTRYCTESSSKIGRAHV